MSASPADLLRQGITAARTGDKETARNLLMRVVEHDEGNATAWMWLSGVVESLDDRQVCLENVLTLDPQNQAARQGLEWVRGQKAASVYVPPLISESQSRGKPLTPAAAMLRGTQLEPEPAPAPPPLVRMDARPKDGGSAPPSQLDLEAMQEFDDETLCPYCAAPTQPDSKRCKACRNDLWKHSRLKPEPSTWFWILIGYLVLNVAGSLCAFSLAIQALLKMAALQGQVISFSQLAGVYMGFPTASPVTLGPVTQTLPPLLFWLMVGVIAIQLLEIVLVHVRWQPMYWFLVGMAVLSLVGSFAAMALAPNLITVIGTGLSFLPILFLLRIAEDFMMKHDRIWCVPDKSLKGHNAFYQRGRECARKEMWALAAIHFRRAAASAPGTLVYHMALAAAYVGLNRYERAEYALREAKRLEPENSQVRELSDLIARKLEAKTLDARTQRSHA